MVTKKGRIKSGISQTGGKFRMVNRLREFTPYHEFFLSMFTGAAHFELNKPRCRYECWNDGESDIINYLVQIRMHPKEFDEMKQGVFGLVSQEICNRIVNGKIEPKNDLERAYYFYYLNKLTFGGSIWKVRKKTPYALEPKGLGPNVSETEIETKTKGYVGMFRGGFIGKNIDEKDIEDIKAKFRGVVLPTVCKDKSISDAKAKYKEITIPLLSSGIGGGDGAGNNDNIEKAKERFRSTAYKGTNPKTTRPFTNNDCGLLSPIEPEAIKRLRYVNLTTYDFRRVYKMFYDAFYVRKGLERECFIYADPPYPGTEKYYGDLFSPEFHQDLLDIMKETPFNFMLSIGGKCEAYLEQLKDWNIVPVKVKYSTDANSQKESQEYIIMNYDIKKIPKMVLDNQPNLMEFIEV